MPLFLLPVAAFFPVVAGFVICLLPPKGRTLKAAVLASVIAESVLVLLLIFTDTSGVLTLFAFADKLVVAFRLDGLGRLFCAIAALLWPLTTIYAFSYMSGEQRLPSFFGFFTMAYGVTVGIAASANIVTLYCFYELLTLVTIPLVIHSMTKRAVRAATTYMVCSIGGAAFAFLAVVYLALHGGAGSFTMGGIVELLSDGKNTALFIYLLGFLGFGVKAAVFPLDFWLPKASVAPTPVTALLHAVAVVKSGAFAIIRLTYYCFGTALLAGTWVQKVVMALTIFTILYGSSMALKEVHFKRRLAYSTVANMSYILFGVTLMSPAGLAAALMHMMAHATIKITSFFAAGAVMKNSRLEYVYELDGLGRRMPVTFACYTVSALALASIPPFNGFISKWSLLTATIESGGLAIAGAVALVISALLTAFYMFGPAVRAYFPKGDANLNATSAVKEAPAAMLVPMIILAASLLLTGLFALPFVSFAEKIAAGLI